MYALEICRFYRRLRLHTMIEIRDSLIGTWSTSQTSKLIKVAMTDTSCQVKLQVEFTDIRPHSKR